METVSLMTKSGYGKGGLRGRQNINTNKNWGIYLMVKKVDRIKVVGLSSVNRFCSMRISRGANRIGDMYDLLLVVKFVLIRENSIYRQFHLKIAT